MLVSLPAAVQLVGVPLVWSKLRQTSNIGFGQKLPGRIAGCCGGATDRSSMSMTPVVAEGPPDTSETRIFTALGGTTNGWFRRVNPDPAMAPCQPALWPVAVKWFC